MAFQPEDSKYRSLEKPFPETAEEFILLEHFCLEEIMGVDWTSSGTGCHQLFFSAVPSINALLREYGMKGVSQDTWKELLEYFKTHFQLAAKPLAAKKLKLTWMGWDPKEKAKKERKLARERESLRKKWPEIPSLQQMKNDKNLWRRKIQELLLKKAEDEATGSPRGTDSDSSSSAGSTPEPEIAISNGNAVDAVQTPLHMEPPPMLHDTGPTGPVLEPTTPPEPSYVPPVPEYLGELSYQAFFQDFDPAQFEPYVDPSAMRLLGHYPEFDAICRPPFPLEDSYCTHVEDDSATPLQFELSMTATPTPSSLPLMPVAPALAQQPTMNSPPRVASAIPPDLVPRRKRRFDESDCIPSTSTSAAAQSPEPSSKRRKADEPLQRSEPPRRDLMRLKGEFAPRESLADVRLSQPMSSFQARQLQAIPDHLQQGSLSSNPSTCITHPRSTPAVRQPTHFQGHPSVTHAMNAASQQGLPGLVASPYQGPSASCSNSGQNNTFGLGQPSLQLPANIRGGGYAMARPSDPSGRPYNNFEIQFINNAIALAKEMLHYPWCRIDEPWTNIARLARSQRSWNAWKELSAKI